MHSVRPKRLEEEGEEKAVEGVVLTIAYSQHILGRLAVALCLRALAIDVSAPRRWHVYVQIPRYWYYCTAKI